MTPKPPDPVSAPRWQQRGTVEAVAYGVIILAGTWWLLGQWAAVLRPLLLAVFLAYVLLPWYSRLRRMGLPAPLVIVGLAGGVTVLLLTVLQIASSSVTELRGELPALKTRVRDLTTSGFAALKENVPGLPEPKEEQFTALNDQVNSVAGSVVASTAGGLVEAAVAALYLLFLLLGAEKLPGRVRHAYPGEKGDRILAVAGRINSAIISYLRAKIISSLVLAVGAGIVLAFFGVKFVPFWMLLTFLCNFIPYIGSVVGFVLPAAYAALQLPPWSGPIAVAVGLLLVQVASATLIEPMLIGRAVGLSPLLILAALAVWGSVWGLPGMFLAVPLTVVLKIVLENLEDTKAFAKLIDE